MPCAPCVGQPRSSSLNAARLEPRLPRCGPRSRTSVEVLPETVGVRVAFVVAITGGLAVTEFERHDSPAVVEIRALYAALKGRLNGQ